MRIDTPSPHPRLLLEPHLTITLDRALFNHSQLLIDRATSALLARHGGGKLLVRTTGGPDDDNSSLEWAARRWRARAHRAAHPISVASTRGAFAASISGDGGGGGRQQQQLPAGFLATADRRLSADAAGAWRLNERERERRRRQPLPLFVYGHWMFPTQLAAAAVLGGGGGRGGGGGGGAWQQHQRQQQPTPASVEHWTQRMLPAVLTTTTTTTTTGNNSGPGDADADADAPDWHRYCIRGRVPTAALLDRGSPRLRYYLRDVGERGGPPVEGRLVLGVSAEEWAALDGFLGVVGEDEGEKGGEKESERRLWGKREVWVEVRVAGAQQRESTTALRAVAYVWEGDPMDLHVFKVDKVWTPELYVEWHGRMREEMAAAAEAAAGADGGVV
ncbi:hypothetical protein UCDDS831_g07379 [Diplodia seriata]|uniref:Uncharacterized protein n=1 Tax=Diplodia seriata TaxID=420778 RepID=A0A0G2GG79_9PEZI|nr:hypothetical protein UCDDS831_g07379 [Diplodia seriata]